MIMSSIIEMQIFECHTCDDSDDQFYCKEIEIKRGKVNFETYLFFNLYTLAQRIKGEIYLHLFPRIDGRVRYGVLVPYRKVYI